MAFSPETYHLFQGIIGASGEGHNGIPGPQHAKQRCGEGMGAGYEVVADQGVLTAEDVCQYRIQGFPSDVAVAIAGGACEHGLTDPVLDKGSQYLPGIVVGGIVDLPENAGTLFLGLTAEGFDPLIYGEKRFFHGSLICPLFCKNRMGNPAPAGEKTYFGGGAPYGTDAGPQRFNIVLARRVPLPEFAKQIRCASTPDLATNLQSKFAVPQHVSAEASR